MTERFSRSTPVRRGFTLIELLVVIGIIVLLMSILLPVAGRVRVQAQSTRTWATLAGIAGAIERYYNDEKTYPGLFTNQQLAAGVTTLKFLPMAPPGAGTELTGTENMVASLAGGIEPDPAGTTGAPDRVILDSNTTIGKGPMNFSPSVIYRTRRGAYIETGSSLFPSQPFLASGYVGGNADMIGRPPTAAANKDTGFPEFYDNYSSPRPIIYLRANVGATGDMCTTNKSPVQSATRFYKYSIFEFNYYKRAAIGYFTGDFNFNPAVNPDNYNNQYEYLGSPSTYDGTSAASRLASPPRGQDKYILISAGADGIFGTRDDQFYAGN